jgi:hypothetical protein
MKDRRSSKETDAALLDRTWNAGDLLKQPPVKEMIRENPKFKKQIEAAARILSEDSELKELEDAVAALKHAAGGIIQGYIDVFFSYKSQDADAARTIVNELRAYAGGKLRITFASEFSEEIAGAKWGKRIREGIKKAHWFILLLPDPSMDWDWCLYETGQFRNRILSEKIHKLICLHHPKQKELPPQIDDLQAVKAEKEAVVGFLKMVFLKDNPVPGMKALNPDVESKIPSICETIIQAIKPRSQRLTHDRLDRHVSLRVRDPKKLLAWQDLNGAELLDVDNVTLSLFGKISKPETWGALIENIATEASDKRWVMELSATIQKAASGNSFGPIQATFKGLNSGKLFRPHLHALDRGDDGTIESFSVLFLEEVGGSLTQHIPKELTVLMTFFRLACRFRLEVVQRYRMGIETEQVQELKDSLDRIETEARSRGNVNPEILLACFKDNEKASAVIENMFVKWYGYRNDARNGKLDIAIKEKNIYEIKQILDDFSGMNREFLEIVLAEMEKSLING